MAKKTTTKTNSTKRNAQKEVGQDQSGHGSDLASLFKSAGLKFTQGRAQVFMSLIEAEVPLTVEAILASLEDGSPDRATVYRILEQFVKTNLAKEIHFKDSIVRYEIVGLEGHDHCCHHVLCKQCGKVEHVESVEVEKALSTMMKKIKNFSNVDEHTLEFFGVCTACSK